MTDGPHKLHTVQFLFLFNITHKHVQGKNECFPHKDALHVIVTEVRGQAIEGEAAVLKDFFIALSTILWIIISF